MEPVHDGDLLTQPARDEIDLVTVLQALGDPVRLQLVRLLDDASGAVCCRELQEQLPVGKSTASHHFKVLREAGVVHCELDGTRRYYTLRHADLDARFPGLLASVLTTEMAADPS